MTVEEYLEFEKNSEAKHDYVDGQVIDVRAMAGNTVNHSRIERNWMVALTTRLAGKPCEPFGSTLKVRTSRRVKYRYPDLSVACPPLRFDPKEGDQLTLLNPTLIIEVLSDSTQAQDRDEKFKEYMEIESFREYVLTSQHRPLVETFYRRDDGSWILNFARGLDAVAKLGALGIEVPLSEIYGGIDFPKEMLNVDQL